MEEEEVPDCMRKLCCFRDGYRSAQYSEKDKDKEPPSNGGSVPLLVAGRQETGTHIKGGKRLAILYFLTIRKMSPLAVCYSVE